MQVVDNAAQLSDKMELRFAALVHDIAKPKTRRIDKLKGYTFHGHDAVGERMLNKVARRMKLSNELKDYLKKLTLLHLRPIALAKKKLPIPQFGGLWWLQAKIWMICSPFAEPI
jgi:putative nucleotidyltransferase with HDIG domain